jgi:autotransporter-associated beta strand protein
VFGGGTLQYGSGITADVSPHIVNSTSSIAVDTGSNAVTFVSALASSNTGGLTKSGSGALTFSAANAYTGTTLISAGSIKLGAADRIADSSAVSVATGATFNLNSFSETVGSIAGAGTIAFGTTGTSVRTLTVGGDNTNTTYSGAFTGTSGTGAMTLTKNGTGVLTLSGNNTIAFNTTIANGTLALGHANGLGTGNIVFGGGILQYGTAITADVSTHIVNSTGAIAIDTNNNSVTYASALVSSNTGGLTKSGLGTLTLSGNNAYTGTTAINNGTLALGHANGLSSGNIVFGGGTLQYATGITADVSPHIVNSASSIAVDTNSNSVTYASAIASSNTGGLTKSGLGELTLTAANTYSGGTTVNGGTLTVSGSGTLGSTSGALTVNTGGILGIGTTNQTVGAVTLAGGTINGTGTLTSNTSFTSTGGTINANLAGTAGFTHTSGTTTLNGTIGYSGDTTVNGGTLIFNSALTSTTASIGSGATLQLAALATGSSIGTLNLNGGTLLLGAGSYSFTTINVTGASTIDFGSGTGATLSNTNFTLDAGASLTVLNWANGVDNFYVDSLSGATLDGTRSTGSLSQISFSGYASNSTGWINEGGYKKITPVPEPGTYGALFGGGALLLWFWRRRENRKIGKSGNRKTWETWV